MRSKILVFFLLVILTGLRLNSQPLFQWHDSIPVRISGTWLENPWAGGLNFVQTSNIDMNLDGKKDLFVFDRTGNKIRTFINNGTAGAVDFTYDPYYETRFPDLWEWALLVDYNCDGKEDIFSYSKVGGGFDVYKNISSSSGGLQFQLVKTLVRSMYNPPSTSTTNLYISSPDVPAITDIDNDGDIDVVTFSITGSYMEYHKNMSKELYGTCDSLKYQMANRCWGYASENAFNNSYTLFDSCTSNVPDAELPPYIGDDLRSAERHAGSCEICLDLDGDNDKEFIVGDISFGNLTMLTNGGSLTSASMVAKDTAFPENNGGSAPVDLTLFPCAYYVDVNYDNVKDLLVSPNAPNVSENFNSLVYYRNNGTNNFPVFQYQQSNLLQDNMIEVGEGAYPSYFDYDNDGLMDLFVGNYGYYAAGGYQHQIAYFRNIGTAALPKYDLITRDFMNLSSLNIINMVPAFGDLDADGDADMIIGAYDGRLHYFQNTAPSGAAANFVLVQANMKNSAGRVIDVGDYATPQIFDVDNDGKNDFVIGAKNGRFAYYHHIGSGSTPILSMDSVSHFFGNVKVNQYGYFSGYSYPVMMRTSGVTRLLSGAENGYLKLFGNIDGNLTGTFTLNDSTYLGIWQGNRTAPAMSDINADGFPDLVVGNYEGGLSFYKGVSAITTSGNHPPAIPFNYDVFPNPANDIINIRMLADQQNSYQVSFYNVMGQLLQQDIVSSDNYSFDASGLANGIYICRINICDDDRRPTSVSISRKVVIRH
jgi:hypothetical protein